MLSLVPFRGEVAALGAALLWAMASFLFADLGKRMAPLWLNLTKSSLAIGFILLTLVLSPHVSPQLNATQLGLLLLSGAIGIGFGDSMFFEALRCLGARRTLLLEAIAPPLSAVLAMLFLQEQLAPTDWLGIALTVAGVVWVMVERTPQQAGMQQAGMQQLGRGVVVGLLSALAQAIGAVLSRSALAATEVSPLWASLLRLTASVVVLVIWVMARRDSWQGLQPLQSRKFLLTFAVAAFLGTYLGVWLQQTALKYTETGIAQALTSTSPLFVIPLTVLGGEPVSFRSMLGALIALLGIWLLFA